ncbi:MAG: hypothetical protein QXE01_07585 [Sulfolobales archaeon]
MVDRRSLGLARKIVGSIVLGIVVASILGVVPAPLIAIIGRPLVASAATVFAENISSINTSRDGPPFNGNVYFNATFQVNITFKNPVNVSAFPNVNITLRILSSDRTIVRNEFNNITAWPVAPTAAFVLLYNVTVFINGTGIFIGNLTGTSTDLTSFLQVSKVPPSDGDILQLGNYTSTGDFIVFRELVFQHTSASNVMGIPSTVAPAPLGSINLAGEFNITAPDLNKFWNVIDNTTILLNIQNDTGYRLIPNGNATLGLNETDRNSGVFHNITVKTLGDLFPGNVSTILPAGNYNLTIYVPKYNSSMDYDVINVSFTVGVPPPVQLLVDRSFIPITVDYNISINVTIVDPSASASWINFGNTLNATFLNYLAQPVKTNVPLPQLFSTTAVSTIGTSTFSLYITINGPLAFQYPYEVQNGTLVITYRSPSGVIKSVSIPLKTVDVSLFVNGSQSIQVTYGKVINITMINPAADTNTSSYDTVNVTVLGAAVPASGVITLNETAPGSGVFTALVWVGDDANISANPEAIIALRYVNRASPDTPFGSTIWLSKTVEANIKILSTLGMIVSPADGTKTGPLGKINVTIVDPDKNRNVFSNDTISYNIKLWDGRVITRTATETGPNTGVFTDVFDKSVLGTPAELLRGGVIQIVYSDVDTPSGPTSVTATVRFFSVDGIVTLDKPFYLPGQNITITVNDSDAVTDPSIVETIVVRVISTSDQLGIQVVLTETAPGSGIFTGTVLVSNNPADRGKERIIYANIGDTITVIYTDKFPADYAITGRSKDITASAFVGQLLEKPIAFSPQVVMTYSDGTPVTQPVAGRTVLFTVNVTNNNPVSNTTAVLFQVFDSNGVPLVLQAITVTLAPGQTLSVTFSFVFPAPGSYLVRLSAVKSLTDLTPLGDKLELTVTVVGGTVAPGVGTSALAGVQMDYRVKTPTAIIAVRE